MLRRLLNFHILTRFGTHKLTVRPLETPAVPQPEEPTFRLPITEAEVTAFEEHVLNFLWVNEGDQSEEYIAALQFFERVKPYLNEE